MGASLLALAKSKCAFLIPFLVIQKNLKIIGTFPFFQLFLKSGL